MINVNELYKYLSERIPAELSCEWDNDGRRCVPNGNKTVNKALVCLDITNDAIDYAIENKIDCIISHHPLVFKPIKGVDDESYICKRLIKLIKNDIAALSFHTRLDVVEGGVNDVLAGKMELIDVCDFADVGRMGETEREMTVKDFGGLVKNKLGSDRVVCV
ncbi:MAG: Nif3-like dinuclear metal center hexameric protein, partial [Clostridia bacterium]|nr:Nif3-like dinuclear metal center hexameric protein [Clostridia bacterium]